jgi:hypothetical protein
MPLLAAEILGAILNPIQPRNQSKRLLNRLAGQRGIVLI